MPLVALRDRALVARVVGECFPRLCEDCPLVCELLHPRMRDYLRECAVICTTLLDLLVRLHCVGDVPREHCVCVLIAYLHYCELCCTELRQRIDSDVDVCAKCTRATCVCIIQTPRLFLEAFDVVETYSAFLNKTLSNAGLVPMWGRDNDFFRAHHAATEEFRLKFCADAVRFDARSAFSSYTVANPSTFLPSEYKKCLSGFNALVDACGGNVV